MRILTAIETMQALCVVRGEWAMYVHFDPEAPWEETLKAAPYLSLMEYGQVLCDGEGFVFGTRGEIDALYHQTIGDDGPREGYTNRYDGPARVYALTCDDDGLLQNENT